MSRMNLISQHLWAFWLACVFVSIAGFASEEELKPEWGVIPEDTDSYQLGRERLLQFTEIAPYSEKPEVDNTFQSACMNLNPDCLKFLQTHKDQALKLLPDNPVYWSAYLALLSETPVARVPADVENNPNLSLIIEATRNWGMHDLLVNELLDVAAVHFVVSAHRRLLAESNFLIDKMLYLATTGITAQTINVLMAQYAGAYQELSPTSSKLLDEMLTPLTQAEYSLRRSFHGEARYWAVLHEDDQDTIDETMRRDLERMRDYVVNRSEADWQDLWGNGVDVVANVPVYSIEMGMAAYAYGDYIRNIGLVDVQLTVLRALREVYEGKVSPGTPALPPPPLFQWLWSTDSLCLVPDNTHPSLGEVPDLCVDYLGVDAFSP